MQYLKRSFLLILIYTLILGQISCTKKPDLKGFDLAVWKSDKGGCKNLRINQIKALKALRNELKSVTENDIGALFGKPDLQRLGERNQEYYIYFVESGDQCQKMNDKTLAKSVAFRFNAMGLTTEVTFQNGVVN
jgi:hypothetical protein